LNYILNIFSMLKILHQQVRNLSSRPDESDIKS
jgi:hypothetical protein